MTNRYITNLKRIVQTLTLSAALLCVSTMAVNAAVTKNDSGESYTNYNYDFPTASSWNSSVGTSTKSPKQSINAATSTGKHVHTYIWVDEDGNAIVNCETSTTKRQICSQCGYEKTNHVTSQAATGHYYDESSWVIDKEPTCTSTGTKHRKCRICGKVDTSSYNTTVAKLAHEYKEATLSSNGGLKEVATCTSNAVYYQKCSKCGEVDKTKYNEVEGTKTNHIFVNGECTECGQKTSDIWETVKSYLNW